MMPLLRKSAQDVIDGLRVADELMPFRLQGKAPVNSTLFGLSIF